ncbi:unnamed protein product, partial [Chrysoparadoxa australica]
MFKLATRRNSGSAAIGGRRPTNESFGSDSTILAPLAGFLSPHSQDVVEKGGGEYYMTLGREMHRGMQDDVWEGCYFEGTDAMDWLQQAGAGSNRNAASICQTMLTMGVLVCARGKMKFNIGGKYKIDVTKCYVEDDEALEEYKKELADSSIAELTQASLVLGANLDIRDRLYNITVFKQCFLGTDAVNTMLRLSMASSVAEAEVLGRAMVASGLLYHVRKEHNFAYKDNFYRFFVDEADHQAHITALWDVRWICGIFTLLGGVIILVNTLRLLAEWNWDLCPP